MQGQSDNLGAEEEIMQMEKARVSDIFDMVVADIERDDPLIQKIEQPE